MAHAYVTLASVETPMERIFKKVMLRNMTQKEREILLLNLPVKPGQKNLIKRVPVLHKKISNLP